MNQPSTSRSNINGSRLRRSLLAIIALFFLSIPTFAGPIISIHIGRPSRNCDGFGFCRIVSTPQGSSDPSAISAEGTLVGRELTLAFTQPLSQHGDIIPVEAPMELDAETSRMLGARGITILPGEYQVDYKTNTNGTVTVPVQSLGFTINVEIGRRSRGCTGFGICSITIDPRSIDNPARAIATTSGDVLTLDLPETSSGVKEKELTIDEDIVLDEATSHKLGGKQVTIPRGTYPVDYSTNPGGTVSLPMQRIGITINIEVGRRSLGCTKLGICSITIGTGSADASDRAVAAIATLDKGKLELAFQGELPDTGNVFTIDENMAVDSAIARKLGARALVIKRGAYPISRGTDGHPVVTVDAQPSGIVIEIGIGRRSRGCSGFGICSITIGTGSAATEMDRAIGDLNGNTLHIDFLTKRQDAEAVLPIDEEIMLDEQTATALGKRGLMVRPGLYPIDYSSNPNGAVNLDVRSFGLTIDVQIGRPSRNCQGLGICSITIGTSLAASADRSVPAIGTLHDGTLTLLFAGELPEQGDVMTIDSDFDLDQQVAHGLGVRSVQVKKGIYRIVRDSQGHPTVDLDVAQLGIVITIHVGRPSANCSGFGLCSITISRDLTARAIPATAIKTGNGTFDLDLLENSPESDSTLHIDNALELDSAAAAALGVTTILPGEYPVDYDSNAAGTLHLRGRTAGTSGVSFTTTANGGAIALPNPADATGTIRFNVRKSGPVTATISDMSGREVAHLLDGRTMEMGNREVSFDAAGLTSGTYYFTINTAAGVETGSVIVAH